MKLTATTIGSLGRIMAEEVTAGERAATAAVRQAGDGLKTAWRAQIIGAGLGTRLAKTIRNQTYPRSGQSLNAAVVVWSKAPVIVGAHDTGPLIRSRNGFWLAIPTPVAGKSMRGGRITPREWERRTGLGLRFVYRRSGSSLLVAQGRLNTKGRAVRSRSKTGRGAATVPIFLLVPEVKLPKRLDLARDPRRAHEASQTAGQAIGTAADQAATGWGAFRDALAQYADDATAWGNGVGSALTSAFRSAEMHSSAS